jgi:DNA polymerase-3 subunit delta'
MSIETALWPIWGHHWAVEWLQSITSPLRASNGADDLSGTADRLLRHAYLFWGPSKVGKSTLARLFAGALLCSDAQRRPCGLCRSCQLMARGAHPDFRLAQPLDKEGHVDRIDGSLRVEQAAEIIRDVALRPLEGRYKIFLLQEIHTANPSFANKLLKTLEEPPAHVILLLTAIDRAALLPTIVSRCQTIELRPIPADVIERCLIEERQVEPAQARLLARLAGGRVGWALEQLRNENGQSDLLAQRQQQLTALWRMLQAGRIERLTLAEQLSSNRNSQHLFHLLELWTNWWRDLLLAQSGSLELCTNIDCQAEIIKQSRLISAQSAEQYLRTLKRIEGYLHHTVNVRLALDVLLLRMPRLAEQEMN